MPASSASVHSNDLSAPAISADGPSVSANLTSVPLSLFEKIWRKHVVLDQGTGQTLLYIDRHYLSDDLPPESFHTLTRRGIPIRRPDATVAMPDHYVSTRSAHLVDVVDGERRDMISGLEAQAKKNGIVHFGLGDERQGIIHVVGPEQGLSLPGMTVVCGDSHTSTHGALGAFGFGIGATEVSHVMATQTLWQIKPLSMQVRFNGIAGPGVTAKDLALAFIRQVGVAGASGHVIEYCGEAIDALSIEARMTLCNLSIEAGARAGMIATDGKTLAYLKFRPFSPEGEEWDLRSIEWLKLRSDPGAHFDRVVMVPVEAIEPMVSWGTDPSQCCAIGERIPAIDHQIGEERRIAMQKSLAYMGLQAGQTLEALPIDRVFIGSCTNGRIEDLRLAAQVVRGRKSKVPALVVPGSGLVKAQAEAEGLDKIFIAAGMQWGTPGCSMCLAVNGDQGVSGERCVSTTNRNFIGRQGPGVRTHLVNPGMAAAAAIHGCLVDYRKELNHASV